MHNDKKFLLKGSVVFFSSQIIITHDKQGPVHQIHLVVASYSSHCIVFSVKIRSFYKNTFLQCKLLQPKALSYLSSLLGWVQIMMWLTVFKPLPRRSLIVTIALHQQNVWNDEPSQQHSSIAHPEKHSLDFRNVLSSFLFIILQNHILGEGRHCCSLQGNPV